MRVAAFQNGYFTALCNRVGKEDCLDFAGESFVCGPDGEVIARGAKSQDEIVFAEIDLREAGGINARQLFLKHRRPELYADWLSKNISSVFPCLRVPCMTRQHELIEFPELLLPFGIRSRLIAA